jgi:hypothetical protein
MVLVTPNKTKQNYNGKINNALTLNCMKLCGPYNDSNYADGNNVGTAQFTVKYISYVLNGLPAIKIIFVANGKKTG